MAEIEIVLQDYYKHPRRPDHAREKTEERQLRMLLVLEDILCEEKKQTALLERIADKLSPTIVSLQILTSGGFPNMTLTASVTWTDGFKGFDATHVQPADWPSGVAFTEKSGNASLTDNHDASAAVTAGSQASVIDATYLGFTAEVDIAAATPTINGIVIDQSG